MYPYSATCSRAHAFSLLTGSGLSSLFTPLAMARISPVVTLWQQFSHVFTSHVRVVTASGRLRRCRATSTPSALISQSQAYRRPAKLHRYHSESLARNAVSVNWCLRGSSGDQE